jgi:Holliday junction resolvasome RuvABC endonuclease subunit
VSYARGVPVVWGIDPSTQRVAFGRRGQGHATSLLSLPQSSHPGERVHRTREALAQHVRRLHADGRPVLVVVEQPFAAGNQVYPQTWYALGALLDVLWQELGVGTEVALLGPQSWKAGAGLGGRVTKAETLRWARTLTSHGLICQGCGNGEDPTKPRKDGRLDCGKPSPAHDRADALAMAVAGAKMLEARAA